MQGDSAVQSGARFEAPATAVFRRWQRPALVVGTVAAALSILGAFLSLPAFMHAYLVAYTFWLGIALGCLAVLMIQNLAGGFWGAVIRRPLEAAARTVPLMAVLFLPVLISVWIGSPILYRWTQPAVFSGVTIPGFKLIYLSIPFFTLRAIVYFAVWIIMANRLSRWSLERDETGDQRLTQRLRRLSAPGLVLLTLTTTFAAFDWLMSLEPLWFSSIFGAMVSMGMLLSGFAFVIALLAYLADHEPFAEVASPAQFNSLGSLLLAFLMLWAYLAFSQFLLIYAGNLVEEIVYYVERIQNGWLGVALFVVLFGFAVPFTFLIFRGVKRNRRVLGWVAALLVFTQWVHRFWMVQPVFAGDLPITIVLNVLLVVAIGGLWIALLCRQLSRERLLGAHDPQLAQGLGVRYE